ncbi:hypothetical protein ACNSOL_10250 [Aliarcobacter lanthieri]|uniref:hypothetical protein n=1 Tax=Aliarcobacter lanthieri TaxID=1355374 RepID=UPI003AAA8EEB
MVDFLVFNELSLPFTDKYKVEDEFKNFFEILNNLRKKNIQKIRMDKNFKEYKIINNCYLQEFFKEIEDINLKDRIREFLANSILFIETPLIKDDESDDAEDYIISTYKYNNDINTGGLACSHFWNNIAISFCSNEIWNNYEIEFTKNEENIKIRHISTISHIERHNDFFDDLEKEIKLDINKENFWTRKNELFSKIKFVDEVQKQIKELDSLNFKKVVSILRDLEIGKKVLNDLDISGEGETVKKNPSLRALREFQINGQEEFFEKHIKNLSNGYRVYFLEKGENIYIGYIGKHLKTKNDK